MKLRYLTCNAGHHQSRHRFGDTPASYLFIESVIDSGILSEAGASRLGSILQAAAAKLQNLAAPGAPSNLKILLPFLAPKGGGVESINKLVDAAKNSQTPLQDDHGWWQQMFDAFGVTDQNIQNTIKQNTVSAVIPPQQAAPQQAGRAQPWTQPWAQPGAQPGAIAATTYSPAAQASFQQTASLQQALNQNAAAMQANQARIDMLRNQLASLNSGLPPGTPGAPAAPAPTAAPAAAPAAAAPKVEDVLDEVAALLLTESDVGSNLRFVASNLIRRLGYPSSTAAREVNWLKKFTNRFNHPVEEGIGSWIGRQASNLYRGARHAIANPGYVAQKYQGYALGNTNQRMAKMAVQQLSDYLNKIYIERLGTANLTPQQVEQIVKTYNGLKGMQNPNANQASREKAVEDMQIVTNALNPNLAKVT